MTNLTAAKRKRMPKRDFALSGDRFPMNDKEHDRLAIGGATRAERAGNISASTASKIKAKARRKLGDEKPELSANDGRGGYTRTRARQTAVKKAQAVLRRRD